MHFTLFAKVAKFTGMVPDTIAMEAEVRIYKIKKKDSTLDPA